MVVSPRPAATISGAWAFGTGPDCPPSTPLIAAVKTTAAQVTLIIAPPLLVRVLLCRHLAHHLPNRNDQEREHDRSDHQRERGPLEQRGHLLQLLRIDVT